MGMNATYSDLREDREDLGQGPLVQGDEVGQRWRQTARVPA